ncbi:hypothetical protein [Thermococcus aciditolerans]|uniref:Uncharacterized protein n=1 Tax=Thermococcus aciditolerans TaxID=2598455 RepID=A0A5C0SKR8_9EURY|nr:hypothetical protein [Thermococcus aciditolerans]QEK14860.1 hypothetical protein FPV09_06900 [Thermococcus aciditolerans]
MSEKNKKALLEGIDNSSDEQCEDVKRVLLESGHLGDLVVTDKLLLTFRIVNVTNSSAVIKITLKLYNVTIPWCNLGNVTLTGKLLLNFTDGYYYFNGTQIGRPSFFILPYELPGKKTLLFRASLLKKYGFISHDLLVENVTFEDRRKALTFIKTFYPPLIEVKSNQPPLIYSRKGYLSASLITNTIYDLDTGVAIGIWPAPWPELYILGIINGGISNYHSAKMNKKLDFSKEYWPYGFVLYKTNIQFPKEQTGKAPDTPLKYYLLLGLVILTASLLRRWKR